MFSLIGGLLKWLCAKPELNVLIVGLDHAGKTVRQESHALAAPGLRALAKRWPSPATRAWAGLCRAVVVLDVCGAVAVLRRRCWSK